jgi:methyltransferase (TIGR00027 family)
MQAATPSSTAQHIALARAHLTWRGILNDPYAEGMLHPRWARIDRALRHRPLTWLGDNRIFAQVGARTCFFDEAVVAGLDAGVRQVVVLGAGYDSRAWRLARTGVRFFEVDHPATQADKRMRAPGG